MSARTGINGKTTRGVLVDVYRERERQHATWGTQRHDYPVWLTVLLMEEVGEVAQAVWAAHTASTAACRRRELSAARAELVQVAAVAVVMIERMDEEVRS